MGPCLENFISRFRGRKMNRTKLTVLIAVLSTLGWTTRSNAKEPLPHGVDPNDWECAYPYSDTTCAKVIEAWANDRLEDPDDLSDEVVICDDCEAITASDSNGNDWVISYRCNKAFGYQITATDLEHKFSVYREGNSDTGWQVQDWAMHQCLRYWRCYDSCGLERGEPVCFVVAVIRVGMFMPVLGTPCDQMEPPESSLLLGE